MLTVYTFRRARPQQSIDLSMTPLDELAETVEDICQHQTSVHLWFGYLDGWMLTPQDEVRIRPALRKFACSLVSAFPLSLSLAWKNEIDTVYTTDPNGPSEFDNNGRAVHDGNAS